MKKIILFSIGILISLTAGMAASQAVVSDDGDALLAEIFKEAGVTMSNNNDAKELENLAQQSKAPFSGLYLFMLQNIKDGPKEAALKEIAKRYKYTEAEIKEIVLNGNTSSIVAKRQNDSAAAENPESASQMEEAGTQGSDDVESFIAQNNFGDQTEAYIRWYYKTYEEAPLPSQLQEPLTSDFLLNEFASISDAYDHELAFQQSNRRLSYEALASEMFMNNDLSDSANVDLLYDLDLVHYLLFGKLISYPDRSGSNVSLASEEDSPGSIEMFKVPESTHQVQLASDGSTPLDPYACYGDTDLASALNTFENDPADTSAALPEKPSTIDYTIHPSKSENNVPADSANSPDLPDSAGSPPPDTGNPYLVDIGAAFQDLDNFLSTLEAPQGNWTRSYGCDDIFCIKIRVIGENDDPQVEENRMEAADFDPSANCIACHTAYIKERLTETMSKSLVPSKISMNWFEDATCKEAGKLVNLDLNVYTIKKPIDLDPGDDLDEEANNDIEDFKSKLNSLAAFPLPIGGNNNLGKPKNEEDCESILNLSKAGKSERSIDELLSQCQDAAAYNAEQIQETFDAFKFNTYSQTTSDLYGQVSSELYTMLLYFQTFQQGIKDTYEQADAPLASLLTKKYCE